MSMHIFAGSVNEDNRQGPLFVMRIKELVKKVTIDRGEKWEFFGKSYRQV